MDIGTLKEDIESLAFYKNIETREAISHSQCTKELFRRMSSYGLQFSCYRAVSIQGEMDRNTQGGRLVVPYIP